MNRRPHRVLDDTLYVQRVPLAQNDLLIAALPNGYFRSDWDVFQNHAVIRRMAEHGYRFFGIGAATIGLVRQQPLARPDALLDDVCMLYGINDAYAREALHELFVTQPWLLLGYTESFGQTALREDRA